MKVGDIAKLVSGRVESGDAAKEITDVAGLYDAGLSDIVFVSSPRHLEILVKNHAGCVLAPPDLELDFSDNSQAPAVIRVDKPAEAFEKVVDTFATGLPVFEAGVHPSSVIAMNAQIDPSAHVGPLCIVEAGAKIGPDCILSGSVFVGAGCSIGEATRIYPNVTLREFTWVGKRVIIHSGSVLGSDGFGFETGPDGRHSKLPQKGRVVVEDDVEIGACVAIDRARFARTVIGRGTKIDNLVHIAHNVTIGEDSLLVAQVGIAGSSHIGHSVILAGQAGIDGHISLGDGVRVAGMAGVTSDVEPGQTVAGYPAWSHMKEKRVRVVTRKLPEMLKEIRELRKRISELEQKTKHD